MLKTSRFNDWSGWFLIRGFHTCVEGAGTAAPERVTNTSFNRAARHYFKSHLGKTMFTFIHWNKYNGHISVQCKSVHYDQKSSCIVLIKALMCIHSFVNHMFGEALEVYYFTFY